MDYAEGTDHTFTVRRQQVADDGQRPVARAAVRFDECPRSRADARAPNRIAYEAQQRLLELGLGVNLDGRARGVVRLRDLVEVLHARAEDDRHPIQRALEVVVA